MKTKASALLSTALRLPEEDRAIMAEKLIASLDQENDEEVETLWQKEIQKRISELENNQVECLPWQEVRRRLRRKLSA